MQILSAKAKWQLSQIIPFGIIWLLLALIFLSVEYAATNRFSYVGEGAVRMNLSVFIFATTIITLIGLIVGTIDLFLLRKVLEQKSFLKKLAGKFLFYLFFLFLIISITFPVAASLELHISMLDTIVWEKYISFLSSLTFLSTAFQLTISLIVSLLYSEISNNIGHGVLINFFIGKYHQPKEEVRIFMFLDMKSSTTIAENLGHIKYFEFLKAYYKDLSLPIIEHSGELYQYVGDEMVISWPIKKGVQDQNCIRCFFKMKEAIKAKKEWFKKEFNVIPGFKAGLHFGKVTIGEVGNLKKEIVFTGDVLNTTARIQSLCNEYEVDNLISEDLIHALNLNGEFKLSPLGIKELKGKQKLISLYSLSK